MEGLHARRARGTGAHQLIELRLMRLRRLLSQSLILKDIGQPRGLCFVCIAESIGRSRISFH